MKAPPFNRRTLARIAGGLVAVLLVAVLAVLLVKTRAIDLDAHNDIVGGIRQMKQTDAELSADLLKSKMGFNLNYDPLAGALPVVASLSRTLGERTDSLAGASAASRAALKTKLDRFVKAMDEKLALIDRFKSQNAILRNSTHFLPTALADLAAAAQAGGKPAMELGRQGEALVAQTMTYLVLPDELRK
ncbi:MAG: DAHL domain-containing protein, partial [Rhodocyclaceae bacterium]